MYTYVYIIFTRGKKALVPPLPVCGKGKRSQTTSGQVLVIARIISTELFARRRGKDTVDCKYVFIFFN